MQLGRGLGVGARRDLRAVVDDRDARPEAREDLRELEPDGACAHDEQRFRNLLELERADVVDPVDVLDAGDARHRRSRSGRDENALGGQLALAHSHRRRVHERRLAWDDLVAGVRQHVDPALLRTAK